MRPTANRELLVLGLATILIVLTMWAIAIRAEDFTVFMHQPEPPTVAFWEVSLLEQNWVMVDLTDVVVIPCVEGCLQMTVTIPQNGHVRVRAVGYSGDASDWSCPLPVPEPGLGVGLMVGIMALAWRRR